MIQGTLTRDRSGEFCIIPPGRQIQYDANDGSWREPWRPHDPAPFSIYFKRNSAFWEMLPRSIRENKTWGPKNWPRSVVIYSGAISVGLYRLDLIYNRIFLKGV